MRRMGIFLCNKDRDQRSGVRDQKRNELRKGWRFDLRSAGVDENRERGSKEAREQGSKGAGERGSERTRERGSKGTRDRDDREQPVANSGWLGDLLVVRPVPWGAVRGRWMRASVAAGGKSAAPSFHR